MRRRKPIRARRATALQIGSVMLLVWLVLMAAVTWITAYVLDERLTEENWDLTGNLAHSMRLNEWAADANEVEQETIDFWVYEGVSSFGRRYNRVGGGILRDVRHPAQTACVIYDGEGNLLEKNGNGLYFAYMTEENWYTAESDRYHDGVAKALYDQSEISEMALEVLQRSDVYALRMTGVIEDGFLTPSKIDLISERQFHDAFVAKYPSGRYESHLLLQEMVDRGDLEWQTFLVSDFEDPNEQVYYSVNCQTSLYDAGDSIVIEGREYENLMSYLEVTGSSNEPGFVWKYDTGNLWDRMLCREIEVFEDPDYENGLAYRVLAAVRFSPMKLAMAGLLYVYVGSFVLIAIAALVLWNVIRRDLILPIETFVQAVSDDWKPMAYGNTRGAAWHETRQLENCYYTARNQRKEYQDEITRLSTALDYAKEAENNRRQMTSAIAHELKTPLAVIRSYAEGLKEHIAEDKRDKYLDVIQSETERLDEMVLEMLDLSRLEAGKVKLARDEISLSELAAAVFEKLELEALGKDLEITLSLRGECRVTADEGRLLQVITNLASNAIQYTPAGGRIWVKTFEDRNFVWFRVENNSQPFSEEELTKIWETFYQTDKARSGKGTGLGLAICKNIIELHGGICRAENTENGVEFWFRLKK